MKTLKARILRTLTSLPHPPAAAAPRVLHLDASRDLPKPDAEPIDAWELVPPPTAAAADDGDGPLQELPARCPPGGEEAVVLYTTTLRGIRKTFEDCNRVRSLLECLRVAFHERDVSMDMGFREELRGVLGEPAAAVVPPRLFVRGRYVGGADEVAAMHEDGRLAPLLRPAPRRAPGCLGCGGLRFAVCWECDGSRKVFDGERTARCRSCNENGLVACPLCS